RLPDRVSVRLDHHRAADSRVLGQPGPANHLAVPAGKIGRLRGQCVRAHRGAPASRRAGNIEGSFVDVWPAFGESGPAPQAVVAGAPTPGRARAAAAERPPEPAE